MPYYEFKCKDCGAKGDFFATFGQIAQGIRVACGVCRSYNVETNLPAVDHEKMKSGKKNEIHARSCGCGYKHGWMA
jgi:hypothetical protein